jgi:RND family efflux transporter MFP subunit
VLVLLASAGCQRQAASQTTPDQPAAAAPRPLEVATVRRQTWPDAVPVQGSLLADEHAVVGAKVAGQIREVLVDLGSVVRQGDVLARLDPEEFDLRVQQAAAQLEQVRAKLGLKPDDPDEKLDRLKSPPVLQEAALLEEARSSAQRARVLAERRAITTEELQQRQAALEVAEARYKSALNTVDEQIASLGVHRAALGLAKEAQADAVIRAPFDGIVARRHVAPGVYLQTGESVVDLVRTNPLRLRAGVPERHAMRIRIGQAVKIQLAGQAQPLEAAITRISPSLDQSSRSLVIEADVSNPEGRLRTGLFAEAEIIVDPHAKTLAVPAAAVIEFAGVEKVWIVEAGEAKELRVRTGRRDHGLVEILEGLEPGHRIAADGRRGRAGKVVEDPIEEEPTTGVAE